MTTQQAFALALQHHEAGRLKEAEALYRQILAVQPNHADALHLLGVVAGQFGRHDLAVEWIRRALAFHPANFAAHAQLGEEHRALGDLKEAAACFGRAVELNPHSAEAQNRLGAVLADQGRMEEAMAAFQQALALNTNNAEAHLNLGIALARQSRFDEAIACLRRGLELKPDRPEAHSNLGSILARAGKPAEAVGAYRRALELRPAHPETWNNLGVALSDQRRFEEAATAFRRALELKPDSPEASENLGRALIALGQFDEALTALRHALGIKPDDPEILCGLGTALLSHGQPGEAATAFRRALEFRPDYSEAWNNLGAALKEEGELSQAFAAFRQAISSNPTEGTALSNIILVMHASPDCDPLSIREEQARWNRLYLDPLRPSRRPHGNSPLPSRPLKIGYVSPDFREHPVGRNLLRLFENHDRHNFQTVCYSGVPKPDHLTEEFRYYASQWRTTVGVADETLAEMIRQDGVDILVDLALHAANNRLTVFARQPAPVQVSFAGYPDSTGVETIRYRISDRYLESEMEDGRWKIGAELRSPNPHLRSAERIFLIESFWCYDQRGVDVTVNALPASECGRVTFGSLNNPSKINEPLLRLWARILRKVNNSRLILLRPPDKLRERTFSILEEEGIAAHRVEFVARLPRRAYLEFHHQLDIVLDPFPYNGHTTSLDALWMGLPVVSLVGRQPVSRGGYSQLSNLDLPELVAFSEDDYVHIAVQLAHDLPRLAELRRTLRPRVEASPLMDGPRYTRAIEDAYRTMWRQWCADQPSPAP